MTEERAAELAKAKEIAAKIEAEFKMKDNHTSINTARTVLLVVGVFEILIGLWQAYGPANFMVGLYADGALGLIFIALYFLSKQQPLPALIVGLLVYIVPQVLIMLISFSAATSGMIWKIIIIVLLSIGIVAATKVPKSNQTIDEDLLDDEISIK